MLCESKRMCVLPCCTALGSYDEVLVHGGERIKLIASGTGRKLYFEN